MLDLIARYPEAMLFGTYAVLGTVLLIGSTYVK